MDRFDVKDDSYGVPEYIAIERGGVTLEVVRIAPRDDGANVMIVFYGETEEVSLPPAARLEMARALLHDEPDGYGVWHTSAIDGG